MNTAFQSGQVICTSRFQQGTGRRGVLTAGGVGFTAASMLVPNDGARRITDVGITALETDLGGPQTFGNDASITATDTAWALMTSATGAGAKNDKMLLYGASMSCLTMLNWAIRNPTLVAAIALLIPPLDLNDAYQNNKGGYQAAIGTAYGVTYPTALPNLATHSPAAYSGTDLAKLTMPIHIWASSDDPIAATTAVAQTWAATVTAATVTNLGAVGHATTGIEPGQVVDFLRVYA